MPNKRAAPGLGFCLLATMTAVAQIMPPPERLVTDRPRLLLRPKATTHAIGLDQLKNISRDEDFQKGVAALKALPHASAQAMVWLLTGDEQAAQKALARLRNFNKDPSDAFDVWAGLRELALAYDWLYNYPGFTLDLKKHVLDRGFVFADRWGVKHGDDHVFHNYVWMNNCGLALWVLACYGDDSRAEPLFSTVRFRLNERMFPAMEHLNGLAGDAMGYWYTYCLAAGVWTLMAIQSAYEMDVVTLIREKQNNWLARQLEGLIHGTLPNMRYIPWGDIQSGPDGGATHEVAGVADAMTWALKSPHGAYFGQWLAGKRGMNRFYGDTVLLYFLYTRHIQTRPAEPELAVLTGGPFGGQVMLRSSWQDNATVVGFRCTDYYQGHFHNDVGSFVIYRNGLLAVDAGRYTVYSRSARAPIVATSAHNTLLLGGQGQRDVEGQWYKDLAEFNAAREDRRDNRRLERGDILFYKHAGEWTAVAGEFAQAYKPGLLKSCVRQLLFVRPDTVVVVDNLVPMEGKSGPEVRWLLNVPREKLRVDNGLVETANEQSWLRCRPLISEPDVKVEEAPVTQLGPDPKKLTEIARVSFIYGEQPGPIVLVHVIEVGDGTVGEPPRLRARINEAAVELPVKNTVFVFSRKPPFGLETK
ncbi:MAG: heparinase II/III-family protein [Kiritimatiellae bacterium]|nr:heparinase II/III-family protein [Kiritimatiellia bacterium]